LIPVWACQLIKTVSPGLARADIGANCEALPHDISGELTSKMGSPELTARTGELVGSEPGPRAPGYVFPLIMTFLMIPWPDTKLDPVARRKESKVNVKECIVSMDNRLVK
jgi:hypothetical protein